MELLFSASVDRNGFAYQTNFKGDGLPIVIQSMKTIFASKPLDLYSFLLKVDIEGAGKRPV